MNSLIIDVLQIKSVERKIQRKLTENEMEQIRHGQDLYLETTDGFYFVVKIKVYNFSDLYPNEIDLQVISRYQNDEYAEALNSPRTPIKGPRVPRLSSAQKTIERQAARLLRANGYEDIEDDCRVIERQVFRVPPPENKRMFELLENALNEMHERGERFADPTDEFIIYEFLQGATNPEISKFLNSTKNTELKRLQKDAVNDRVKKILKQMEIDHVRFWK